VGPGHTRAYVTWPLSFIVLLFEVRFPMIPLQGHQLLYSVSGLPFSSCLLNCLRLLRGGWATIAVRSGSDKLRRRRGTHSITTATQTSITCLSSRHPFLDALAPGLSLDLSTHPRRLLGRVIRLILPLAAKLEAYLSSCIQALGTVRTSSKMILAPWTRSI